MKRTPEPEPAIFAFTRRHPVITLVGILVAAAFVSGLFASHSGSPGGDSSTPTANISGPTPTPTLAPITGSTLGGTEHAFTTAYGTPVDTSLLTWRATIAGQPVQIIVDQLQGSDTQDSQPHIYLVDIEAPTGSGLTWSASTATSLVAHFFPRDARHISDFQAPTGGTDHVYRSQALAATFDPSKFLVVNGTGTVPPGTFDWICVRRTTAGGVPTPPFDLCEVGIGQNYAR
jgi:hypothetical protein